MADVTPDEKGLFTIPEDDAKYLIPNNVYQVLKWVALIFLPAVGVLVGTVGHEWGLPNIDAIVTTINAIGLFIGMCIGVSQITKR